MTEIIQGLSSSGRPSAQLEQADRFRQVAHHVESGPADPVILLQECNDRNAVRRLPLDLTYKEGPGEHNWAYWDTMIQNMLAWMFPAAR